MTLPILLVVGFKIDTTIVYVCFLFKISIEFVLDWLWWTWCFNILLCISGDKANITMVLDCFGLGQLTVRCLLIAFMDKLDTTMVWDCCWWKIRHFIFSFVSDENWSYNCFHSFEAPVLPGQARNPNRENKRQIQIKWVEYKQSHYPETDENKQMLKSEKTCALGRSFCLRIFEI